MRSGRMLAGIVTLVLVGGCPGRAPAPAEPKTPDGAEASEEPTAQGPAPKSDHSDAPASFGYAPGEVAVISWTGGKTANDGRASLTLPTGEHLDGTWHAQDNRAAEPEAGGRVQSTDPRGDPGDPTSMPAGHPHARQIVIDLSGDRGARLTCTIPTRKPAVGHCRDEARGFDARLR